MAQATRLVPAVAKRRQAALPGTPHAQKSFNYCLKWPARCRTARGTLNESYQGDGSGRPTARVAPVFTAADKADVTPRYRRVHELLQEAGAPAGWMEMVPGFPVLYVRDPDMIVELLTDNTRFPRSLPGSVTMVEILGKGIANAIDPELHRKHREALTPHFRTAYIRTLVPRLTQTAQAAAATLVALSRNGGSCNVDDLFRRVVLDNFGRTDLGYEFHSVEDLANPHDQRRLYDGLEFLQVWDEMMEIGNQLVGSQQQRQAHPQFATYQARVGLIRSLMRQQISAARYQLPEPAGLEAAPAPGGNLITLLLQQQASGAFPHLTDDVLEDELMVMLLGAFDTTASTLSWTLHHLLTHPLALASALADISAVCGGRPPASITFDDYRKMEYLMACITETLRYSTPSSGTSRLVAADTTLGGGAVEVPKGVMVSASFYALHHHEDVYERAEEWLPERWLLDGPQALKPKHKDALLPFGAGARICLGRQYALLALPVMLAQLLATVHMAEAPGAPPVRLGPSFVARSAEGIWVTAEPVAARDPGQ